MSNISFEESKPNGAKVAFDRGRGNGIINGEGGKRGRRRARFKKHANT